MKKLAKLQNKEPNAWRFAGAELVKGHECLIFESELLRNRKIRIFVEDSTSSLSNANTPRIWRIKVEARDGSMFQSDIEEHVLSQQPSTAMSTTAASLLETDSSWNLAQETFEPRDSWGCKDFALEAKVLKEQGLPLPAEHRYEETIAASAAHKKSLALMDAQAVAMDENDRSATIMLSLSSTRKIMS